MQQTYKPGLTNVSPPEGWIVGMSDEMVFDEIPGWEKRVETMDELSSGFHK